MKHSILATTMILFPGVILAGDWPRFRGPDGNGISAEKLTLLNMPTKLWTKDVGEGNASLLIGKGRLYTVGYQKSKSSVVMSCLDAKTGRTIWETRINSGGADSSPLLLDGRLFVLCHLGTPVLRCLQAENGKELWATELPKPDGERSYGHTGSPLPWKDLIIVNAGTGAAVNRKTGKVVWQYDGLPGLATPVLYQDRKTKRPGVLIFAGKELIARDIQSGRKRWSLPWKTDIAVNAADPIYHEGRVFISTTYGKHAGVFDISTGRPEMVWKTTGAAFSSGFLLKDHLYCFANGRFACFEFHTGKRKWMHHGVGNGSAILTGDKILLLGENGKLWIAPQSTEEFRPILETQIHGGVTRTPPSLSDGRLYVRNKEGLVICQQVGQ